MCLISNISRNSDSIGLYTGRTDRFYAIRTYHSVIGLYYIENSGDRLVLDTNLLNTSVPAQQKQSGNPQLKMQNPTWDVQINLAMYGANGVSS